MSKSYTGEFRMSAWKFRWRLWARTRMHNTHIHKTTHIHTHVKYIIYNTQQNSLSLIENKRYDDNDACIHKRVTVLYSPSSQLIIIICTTNDGHSRFDRKIPETNRYAPDSAIPPPSSLRCSRKFFAGSLTHLYLSIRA